MIAIAPQIAEASWQANARAQLAHEGRIHIPNFLSEEAALALHAAFAPIDWLSVFRSGDQQREGLAREFASFEPARRAAMEARIHQQAAAGFQYYYDSHRVSHLYDTGAVRTGVFSDFYAGVNTREALGVFAAITGEDRIRHLDMQATRYRPGQFLVEHDDAHGDQSRLYAYVLNLTPRWRTDWGGLLMFYDGEGHVARAYAPRWNALNIFKVPQIHAVSLVAPFAAAPRLSITGWMRTKP